MRQIHRIQAVEPRAAVVVGRPTAERLFPHKPAERNLDHMREFWRHWCRCELRFRLFGEHWRVS